MNSGQQQQTPQKSGDSSGSGDTMKEVSSIMSTVMSVIGMVAMFFI